MGKGRFVNQKLGKRTSRRLDLMKSGLRRTRPGPTTQLPGAEFPRKGPPRSGGNAS